MMVSASSGTTSQAIFSITSRLALESASRNSASPPSPGGGTTLRAGLCAADGTGRRGVGAGAVDSSTTSSTSSGMSSSSSKAGGCGGRAAAGGGLGGGAGLEGGAEGCVPWGADGREAGAAGGLAGGVDGRAAAGGGTGVAGRGGGGDEGLAAFGVEMGLDAAPAGAGGRAITMVVPAAPGETAGLEVAGGPDGLAGGTPGLAGPGAAAAMAGLAFGFARMVFTCSISLALSKGFGMWPFAPTAFAGSIGVGPPRSSTGTSLSAASARTRWQSSYPPSLGMLTSARIRSGFDCFAAWSAASPSSTATTLKSSPANVIPTACWMVLESSARRRFLAMRAASTAGEQAVQGYKGGGKLSQEGGKRRFARIIKTLGALVIKTLEACPRGRPPTDQTDRRGPGRWTLVAKPGAARGVSNRDRRRPRNPFRPFRPCHPSRPFHPSRPCPRRRRRRPSPSSWAFRRPSPQWSAGGWRRRQRSAARCG